ncbi:MAG: HD domain-containing protein [Rickettsiaceae bacterium]|nr:HD domain-containing protein [Rickettsiaceae bacterium]
MSSDSSVINVNAWIKQHVLWCSPQDEYLIQTACDLIDNQELLGRGLSIAKILSTFTLDINLLVVGLVYESFCKNKINNLTIEQVLGFTANNLVLGLKEMELMPELDLRKYCQDQVAAKKCDRLESLLASNQNIQIILIKLAIQLYAMQTSINSDESTKLSLAHQTQILYAPLTKRLNMGQVTWQLEDLAFKFLHPRIYKEIATLLDERRIEREDYIFKKKQQIEECLKLYGIEAEVCGRAKHIYSIWNKMKRKMIDYNEIHDTYALRIIVPNVMACYSALRVVHTLWQHLPQELDDYIANPKSNGYKSLHTKIIGLDGKILEVQIRTTQMHREAELGVAAHWRYKADGKTWIVF